MLKRRPRQARKRSLRPETLEARHLMSGDGIGAGLAAADETVQTAAAANDTTQTNFESLEALRQWITAEAIKRYGDLFGTTQTRPYWGWGCDCGIIPLSDVVLRSTNFDATTTDVGNFSTTNTQVAGVDEADLIETDGEFVYLLTGNELVVVDARDPDDLQIASRVELATKPTGMYLHGDRLTLVSSSQASYYGGPVLFNSLRWGGGTQTAPTVTVTVLDLADRSAPTQVEQTEIDGTLLSSRLVDGQLRLVTQQNAGRYLPSPNYTSSAVEQAIAVESVDPESVSARVSDSIIAIDIDYIPREYEYTYESLDEYVDRVVAQWTPSYRTLSTEGDVTGSGYLVGPTEIEIPASNAVQGWNWGNSNRTTVMTFDVTDETNGPQDTLVLETYYAANLHGTLDGLYVLAQARPPYGRDWMGHAIIHPSTVIWKLSFGTDGIIETEARGAVLGSLTTQFAADEHDGYLRVVTSTDWGRDQRLSVLEQVGDRLVEVGTIQSLAPNETIHSVRFQGDEAYVVTFRRIDPLFAIDLSDPANPTVEGELKIPGFSDYLHPIGEDHLLGIGRDADETTGRIDEMQVSIFDVTSLSDPQLTHQYSVEGGRSVTSEAIGSGWFRGAGNHHAVSFYGDEGVLALPIKNQEWPRLIAWGDDATTGHEAPGLQPGEGGLLVLSIDVTAGISKIDLIQHETPIQRSLRIGDTLIAVSLGQVSTHDFGDLTGERDRLDLAATAATRPGTYTPGTRAPLDPDTAGTTVAPDKPVEPATPSRARATYTPVARESLTERASSSRVSRTAITPAARDAALLLIDRVDELDDESVIEPATASEATTPEPSARGVRSAWRPSVRG